MPETAPRLLLAQEHMDGRPEPSLWGTAVLLGTTLAELGKWVDLNGDPAAADKLPAWLIQQGRRRSREAQAVTENGTVTAVLTHWAIRDFGAGVLGFDFLATANLHELWMIATPEVAQQITGGRGRGGQPHMSNTTNAPRSDDVRRS
jgi:hypothetical protein